MCGSTMSVVMQSSIRKDNGSSGNFEDTLVPAANIGSSLSWPIFVAGLIFSMRPLLMLGILLFGLAVIFQLVTLPVEFNASSRAIRTLRETECLEKVRSQEQKSAQSGSYDLCSKSCIIHTAAAASCHFSRRKQKR